MLSLRPLQDITQLYGSIERSVTKFEESDKQEITTRVALRVRSKSFQEKII